MTTAPQVGKKNMNCHWSGQINRSRVLLLGSAALATSAMAQSVQTPEANDQGLNEIVVTAQRVSQPLQKTPASISVLTADTLETAGVQNLSDVSSLIPNLTFTDGYRAGVPNISLRGIPTVQGGDPPAAFVVDGVQVPALDFVNQEYSISPTFRYCAVRKAESTGAMQLAAPW
jgi:iron complex outermembrane receptor protein